MASPADVPWMVATLLVPLAAAPLAFVAPRRAVVIGLAASVAITACVAALVVQVLTLGVQRHAVGGWDAPLGIELHADGLSAVMLALTAAVGLAVSVYASVYFGRGEPQRAYFWPLWLFLWAALNALFLSGDAFNLYVALELLGLSAVALAALTGSAAALRAALRYLLVGLLGSLAYLLGVTLLYAGYGTLDLAELSGLVRREPATWAALSLMSAGLALKAALFPLHFWLPPAHANAPAPVSALLSALVVKASLYVLLRLWFETFAAAISPAAAQALGILGAAAVVGGSLVAWNQRRLKLLVAYSTVAQLGYLFLAFPLIAAVGRSAWSGTVYLALSHGVAKAAMFLSAGTIMQVYGHDRIVELRGLATRLPLSMLAFALAGVSLIGLPPSGGFLAKWMLLQSALAGGQWWWAAVVLLGGLLAAAYVFRVVAHAFAAAADAAVIGAARALEWSALALALTAVALGFSATPLLALLQVGASGVGATAMGAAS